MPKRDGPEYGSRRSPGRRVDRHVANTTPKRKIPPRGGTFLALTQFVFELAVLLALLALTLTVRILLLLAGLLAAALLLAGLLTRVLILLARILILVRHSGTPFLRCWEHN